ncbi:hypothetical protein GGR54DRAFT_636511 [Hypoxylon sp. NC1633]|nr:hypothetical protein GGR54DRAFT_636511 [Hypoxylon sp. NC1633]
MAPTGDSVGRVPMPYASRQPAAKPRKPSPVFPGRSSAHPRILALTLGRLPIGWLQLLAMWGFILGFVVLAWLPFFFLSRSLQLAVPVENTMAGGTRRVALTFPDERWKRHTDAMARDAVGPPAAENRTAQALDIALPSTITTSDIATPATPREEVKQDLAMSETRRVCLSKDVSAVLVYIRT